MKQFSRTAFLGVFFIFQIIIGAAQPNYFRAPVKIPMYLSGNFGELRTNHFHSGIDIKTNGVVGEPVYPVANGYISRISVSPSGFGNALYINHSNGTTSVYGHLQSFRKDIAEYVKTVQYKKKSFRVNIIVPEGKFAVSKNDIIARSGNSGSSGGPHLHFEIRDTKTEEPLNPLKYHFEITDKIAPKLFSLLIKPMFYTAHVNYTSQQKKYDLVYFDGEYRIKGNPVIPVYGNLGFAISTNDYLDGSWNKCGINSIELFIDDELFYSFTMDRFSFSDTRYINSYIVYDEYIENKQRYQKMWIDPNNKLKNYRFVKEDGTFTVRDNLKHNILVVVKDSYGNISKLRFAVEGKYKEMPQKPSSAVKQFFVESVNHFNNDEIKLTLPQSALYTDINFEYHKKEAPQVFYSPLYSVHKNTTPLHRSGTLKIKAGNLPNRLKTKAIIVGWDKKTSNSWSVGGEYKNGWVETKISAFGDFAVSADTIAPEIIPLSIKNKNELTEAKQIRFKISDDLSGIKLYEGFIDDNWELFEYDAKNNLLTHRIDPTKYDLKKRHRLVLKVEDYKNNQTVYEATFWK